MNKFVSNLQSLSPQDLEDTRDLLDTDQQFAAQFKQELDTLDAADYEIVQGIIMNQGPSAEQVPEGQQVASARDVEQKDSNMGLAASAAQGLAQSVPFADEVQAAAGVAVDTAFGFNEGQSLQESFDENLEFIRGYDRRAQEANPGIYTTGRVVGEIGTSLAAGGAAVKALGTVSSLGVGATHLTADVVMETARQLSSKEAITYETFLESTGTASMYAAVGLGIGAGVSKGLKAIGNFGSKVTRKVYEKALVSRGNAKMAKSVSNFLADQKTHVGDPVTEADYIDALKSLTDYESLVKEGNFEGAQLLLKGKGAQQKAAKESIVRQLESKFGDEFAITAKEAELLDYKIFDTIQKAMESNPGAPTSVLRNLQKTKERVSMALSSGRSPETGDHVFGALNYTKLQAALDSLQDIRKIKLGSFDGERVLGEIRNAKNGLHSRIPLDADNVDVKLINALPKMNKQIQVYKHAESAKANVMAEMADMTEQGMLKRSLGAASDAYRRHSRGSGAFGYLVGGPVMGVAGMARSLLAEPATLGRIEGIESLPALKNTMDRVNEVGSFFAFGSGSKSPYAGTLMSRMFTAVADEDNEKALTHFAALNATKELLKNPLDRTTDSFMANKEAVMAIARAEDTDLAEQLQNAIDNKEPLGPILEALAGSAAGSELVKPGLGWDGKVYSEEAKAELESEILDNVFITGDYKIQMVKALREQGTIPQLDEVPKREPRRYETRGKRRPF